MACAVKINPLDTLSVNNFGAYLRMLDSTKTALSVHLYANSLFSQSPVILTQIGCSYFELKDYRKAEDYFKEALKYDPGFGQAHSALCDLYLQTGRWKDALQQLFAAVVGNGMSYGNAHGNFGMIKNASQSSSSGGASLTSNITNQNSSGKSDNNDSKGDFWGENNLQIRPADMLSSLDPDANIPDNEKLAPLVPPDYHLKMPGFPLVSKLEDWTKGGAFGEAVNGYQSYMATLTSFNSEFQKVHQAKPAIPPDAILRDYPNERFAIDCILEYFRYQSKKEYKTYAKKVAPLPEQAGLFIEDYFKKHEKYRQELENCLKTSYENYEACKVQCERYPAGSAAREVCQRNCSEQAKYRDSECNRLYCLHDCNAANDCNTNMNGVFGQFHRLFAEHKKKQEELLNDLYAFNDKWLAKIQSPYWSKIYAYEINREALGIIGHVYVAYQQAFQSTVTSDCGLNCSEYVIQPPVPIGKVITKEMQGNECPPMGKHKVGFGICDLGFDCESIEFGCTEVVSVYAKRNFKKKTSTGFLGLGVKGDAGVLSASARAGFEVTVNDNMEVEDVGAKMNISVSTGWGPAKVSATSSVGYSVMTGLNSKPSMGISGKAE
jgi:tetratricopeptide (TPR) repeat protein